MDVLKVGPEGSGVTPEQLAEFVQQQHSLQIDLKEITQLLGERDITIYLLGKELEAERRKSAELEQFLVKGNPDSHIKDLTSLLEDDGEASGTERRQ